MPAAATLAAGVKLFLRGAQLTCARPAHPGSFAAMNALSVRGLTKTYKNGVQALKGVDLEVERGDFFALLGPNGAGKTTLIGIVTSLVNKSGGEARVFGYDIDRELEAETSDFLRLADESKSKS